MTPAQKDWNAALKAAYKLTMHLPIRKSVRLLNAIYAAPAHMQERDPYGIPSNILQDMK